MSVDTPATGAHDVTERFAEFYRTHYEDAIAELALAYPSDQRSLYIEYADLYRFDHDLAEDYRDRPAHLREFAEQALTHVDLPADIPLSGAHVRLTDTQGAMDRIGVTDLGSAHIGQYVAVEGTLARVTDTAPKAEELTFECQRCGTPSTIPQPRSSVQEPHECQGCDRQGPFTIDGGRSEFVDQRRVKLEQPVGEAGSRRPSDIPAYVQDDLCAVGGENGLPDRSGDRVTLVGHLRLDESSLDGRNADPEAGLYLDVHAIAFDDDSHDVDIEAHREAFEAEAAREDAIDRVVESLLPGLYRSNDALDTAFEAAVAWLFGAPRLDPDDADTKRGDIHVGLIGDPGTGKSSLGKALAEIAPRCEFASGTGLSSGVGLTAAAVQEEFAGKTEWALSPGVLPRANGGHTVIDEIDKAPGDAANKIHDALEAPQEIPVQKANIDATLPTRTALLAIGNPVDGRWDPNVAVAEQLDLDAALVDRMDVLLELRDEVDEEADAATAEHILDAWAESADLDAYERGERRDEPERDVTDRPVPVEVLRAWIAHARETVHPTLSDAATRRLKEFYVEVRGLNDSADGPGADTPIPATPRSLEAGIRLAMAFARVELSDTVEPHHAERAIDISRATVGTNFDPASGQFDAGKTDSSRTRSQKDRVETVKMLINESEGEEPASVEAVVAAATAGHDLTERQVEETIETLKHRGEVYEPGIGEVRLS